MTSGIVREENGTIKLSVTIPWEEVSKSMDRVKENVVKTSNMPGFRKGKAPKKLVEENINVQALKEEVLKNLLPNAYIKAVTEHNLKPIMNPKIHVGELADGKDWTFEAYTVEMPEVKLNDYKKKIQDITAKSKIVVPGKENTAPDFNEIVKTLLETVEVTIPPLLTEQETDRLLAQSLDEIKRLGLTLDQYLASTGRTPEQFRGEYMKKAEGDIKLEFVLQKIAETEKIAVEQKEIDEAILKAKDPKEQEHMRQNSYLLANILRQQKTLDFLKSL
jgi:FKBP-type peptidyl-prolyl cis-trans isomerase (trigger factor)